jgi:hypothetical protein
MMALGKFYVQFDGSRLQQQIDVAIKHLTNMLEELEELESTGCRIIEGTISDKKGAYVTTPCLDVEYLMDAIAEAIQKSIKVDIR